MPQVQNIEPSRVIHELILKPYGTYIIRSATENDDILTSMKIRGEKTSVSYFVLSVRVNENEYHWPIMNYRILSAQTDNLLIELHEELIIKTDDTDWKIKEILQTGYMNMFPSDGENNHNDRKADIPHESGDIKVYLKPMKNTEHELTILKSVSYFHIAQFYGIYKDSLHKQKYLVFADHGESLKNKYPDIKLSDEMLIEQLTMFGYQIACGMIYLESKKIIHRDLHAGNILIDEHNYLRITDFEHAIIDNDHTLDSKLNFQRRRLAPECLPQIPENDETIDSKESLLDQFSSKSDVWAYGLIFIELTLEQEDDIFYYLFPESSISDVDEMVKLVKHLKIDRCIHEKPDDCPKSLYNILKKCWEFNSEDRISFMDVRNEMLNLFESIT